MNRMSENAGRNKIIRDKNIFSETKMKFHGDDIIEGGEGEGQPPQEMRSDSIR